MTGSRPDDPDRPVPAPPDPLAKNAPLRRLAILTMIVVAAWLAFFQVTNLDIGGHLTVGRQILKTHTIPSTDFLSHTVAGSPYPVHQWLGEVILFGVDYVAGVPGLIVLRMIVVTLGALLLYRVARAQGAPVAIAVAIVLAMLVAARPRFFLRPFLVTMLFLPLLMTLIDDVRRGKTRRLWPILPLMTVWGHVHSGVLFGVLFLGATIVGEGLKKLLVGRRPIVEGSFPGRTLDGWNYRRLVGFSILAIGLPYATMALINPSGVKPLLLPLLFWKHHAFRAMITEYKPVDVLVDWPFDLVATACLLGILIRPKRVDLTQLLVAGGFGLMAFQAVRGILPFAIVATPLLARTWGTLGDDLFARVVGTKRRRTALAGAAAPVAASEAAGRRWSRANAAEATVLALVIAGGVFAGVRASQDWMFPFGFGRDPKHYPEHALDFLWSQNVRGPIFNTDLYASALLWRGKTTRFPVFVDARLEAYPEDFWRDVYYRVLQAAPGWQDVLDRYGVRCALLRREGGQSDDGIGNALWDSPAWGLVYWDDQVLIYLKRDGPERNREVLATWEFDAFNPRRPSSVNDLRDEDLKRAETELARLVEWNPESFLLRWTLAAAWAGLGRGEDAADAFAQLADRKEAKGNTAFRASRAQAELVVGRRDRWAELLRAAGRDPADPSEKFRAAMFLARAGRTEPAIEEYREVLAANPRDVDAMNNLALLLAKDPASSDEALALLEQALTLTPDDPYVIASRAEVRYGRGETELALADFRVALDLLPADDAVARETVMRWILKVE